MFRWRRPRSEPPRDGADSPDEPATDPQPVTPVDDQALDAFVQVLRAFGQYAFDLDRENVLAFGELCSAWVRHLLTLAPPPVGSHAASTDPARAGDGETTVMEGRRDWATVV